MGKIPWKCWQKKRERKKISCQDHRLLENQVGQYFSTLVFGGEVTDMGLFLCYSVPPPDTFSPSSSLRRGGQGLAEWLQQKVYIQDAQRSTQGPSLERRQGLREGEYLAQEFPRENQTRPQTHFALGHGEPEALVHPARGELQVCPGVVWVGYRDHFQWLLCGVLCPLPRRLIPEYGSTPSTTLATDYGVERALGENQG